jgi:hypothetical protein
MTVLHPKKKSCTHRYPSLIDGSEIKQNQLEIFIINFYYNKKKFKRIIINFQYCDIDLNALFVLIIEHKRAHKHPSK